MMRILVLALFVFGLAMAPMHVDAQTIPTIRIGGTFPGEEPIWLIVKRPELFKNVNKSYRVQFSIFQGSPPISQALVTNAVDCGSQAPISMGRAVVDGGLQAYILGALVDERPGYFSVFFAVKDDSPIKTAADLKGKTIAGTAFGGGVYYSLRFWLQAHGLDPDKDVKLVEMPFPIVDDALRGGRIDMGPYAQPWASAAERKGGIRRIFDTSEVQSPLVNVFEACRKDFTDANPAVIRAFMEDYQAAMAYALSHLDETRQVTSEITKIPVDVLKTFLLTKDDFYRPPDARPEFDAIQKTWDIYAANGILKHPIKVTDYERPDVTPGGT